MSEDAVGYGLWVLRAAGLVARRKLGRVVLVRSGPNIGCAPTPQTPGSGK